MTVDSKTKNLECLLCDKSLERFDQETDSTGIHPIGGLAFRTYGHYGSTVFDPMDGSYMEVALCDDCVKQKIAEKKTHPKENKILVEYIPMFLNEGPFGDGSNSKMFDTHKEFVDWAKDYVCIHCLADFHAFNGKDPKDLGDWLSMGCGAEINVYGDVDYNTPMELPDNYEAHKYYSEELTYPISQIWGDDWKEILTDKEG